MPPGSLSTEQLERLREGVIESLSAGIDARGASIDDFRHVDGVKGSFQDRFLVHLRAGEPCARCGDHDRQDPRRRTGNICLRALSTTTPQTAQEGHPTPVSADGQALARRVRRQALACERSGSPLYATLLVRLAEDTEAGGPALGVLAGHELDPPGSALALRLMGAVHRLVLGGSLPDLAVHYPSAGGDGDSEACWLALQAALSEHSATLRELITQPVQTNEVGRSAALVGGFLQIAAITGLPLRVLELGASAGLNLHFDRYFYATANSSWVRRTPRSASKRCMRAIRHLSSH